MIQEKMIWKLRGMRDNSFRLWDIQKLKYVSSEPSIMFWITSFNGSSIIMLKLLEILLDFPIWVTLYNFYQSKYTSDKMVSSILNGLLTLFYKFSIFRRRVPNKSLWLLSNLLLIATIWMSKTLKLIIAEKWQYLKKMPQSRLRQLQDNYRKSRIYSSKFTDNLRNTLEQCLMLSREFQTFWRIMRITIHSKLIPNTLKFSKEFFQLMPR